MKEVYLIRYLVLSLNKQITLCLCGDVQTLVYVSSRKLALRHMSMLQRYQKICGNDTNVYYWSKSGM